MKDVVQMADNIGVSLVVVHVDNQDLGSEL